MNRKRIVELTKYAFDCALDSACSYTEQDELEESKRLAIARLRPSRRRSSKAKR